MRTRKLSYRPGLELLEERSTPTANVTGSRRVVRPARRQASSLFRQTITFTNTSDQAIEGPLYLFLGGLTPGVRAVGATASARGAFVQLVPTGGSLVAGETATFVLTFRNPLSRAINYTPRMMAGVGEL